MEQDTKADKLYEILNYFQSGMFTTLAADGKLESRPMAIAGMSDEGDVLLVSKAETKKVDQVEEHREACLTCQSEHSRYLSLSGPVYVSDDVEILRKVWNPMFDTWFPEGPSDPTVVLLVFVPRKGEYWDETGFGKAAYLYETSKAFVRGRRPTLDNDPTYHGEVRL